MTHYTKPIRTPGLVKRSTVAKNHSLSPAFPSPEEIEAQELLLPQLQHHFSEDELRDLCQGLGLDYEQLPGMNKAHKTRDLVVYLGKSNQLPALFAACAERRPHVPWPTT